MALNYAKRESMPYLDWKDAPVSLDVKVFEDSRVQLTLALGSAERDTLLNQLQLIFWSQGHELRMRMPNSWILFWKSRESGSRALVAHPEANEWVGTFALEVSFGQSWVSTLQALSSGETAILGAVGALDSVSNFELSVCILKESDAT